MSTTWLQSQEKQSIKIVVETVVFQYKFYVLIEDI